MDDANGHEHVERSGEDRRHSGGRVTERDYFERILQERRRAHDAEHGSHAEKHARRDASPTVRSGGPSSRRSPTPEQRERTNKEIIRRLDTLESGGAPFASRLDDSLERLKQDVETLKIQSVEQTALDGLRQANTDAIAAQKRQIKYILITAGVALMLSLILFGIRLASGVAI
jgi:hypothetical protein